MPVWHAACCLSACTLRARHASSGAHSHKISHEMVRLRVCCCSTCITYAAAVLTATPIVRAHANVLGLHVSAIKVLVTLGFCL